VLQAQLSLTNNGNNSTPYNPYETINETPTNAAL